MLERIVEKYHLNDPYPVQYYYWVTNLVQGNWGYSPTIQQDVLTAIIQRTPVTAELTLYSILVFIPLGLISGVVAGSRQNKLLTTVSVLQLTSPPPYRHLSWPWC